MSIRLSICVASLFLLVACTAQGVRPDAAEAPQSFSITVGDSSAYVRTVSVASQDLKGVCNIEHFKQGFRYTYMSMWNGRLDKIMEGNPPPDQVEYYKGRSFNSVPGKKATLDANPSERDTSNMCLEGSYQQGKMRGFMSALADLKILEDAAPK